MLSSWRWAGKDKGKNRRSVTRFLVTMQGRVEGGLCKSYSNKGAHGMYVGNETEMNQDRMPHSGPAQLKRQNRHFFELNKTVKMASIVQKGVCGGVISPVLTVQSLRPRSGALVAGHTNLELRRRVCASSRWHWWERPRDWMRAAGERAKIKRKTFAVNQAEL